MREEDKYRGIGEKEVIKKGNGKRSKTTESGGARKKKNQAKWGRADWEGKIKKEEKPEGGMKQNPEGRGK